MPGAGGCSIGRFDSFSGDNASLVSGAAGDDVASVSAFVDLSVARFARQRSGLLVLCLLPDPVLLVYVGG